MHLILFYEVIENFVAKREPFRAEHLKKAQEAYDRGDLVLAGALAEPVDYAVLLFNGADPNVAERFASSDPYVTNGLVKHWNVRKWTTVVGSGATIPSPRDAALGR